MSTNIVVDLTEVECIDAVEAGYKTSGAVAKRFFYKANYACWEKVDTFMQFLVSKDLLVCKNGLYDIPYKSSNARYDR